MKLKYIILVAVLISVFATLGFKDENTLPKFESIVSVEVHIGGSNQEEDRTFYLEESLNIKEILKIHDALNHYKDPKVKTWTLDVELIYTDQSGKKETFMFQGIRPVDDYFETIMDSFEYKVQTNPLFSIQAEDVTQVRIEDQYIDRHREVTILNHQLIEKILEAAKKSEAIRSNQEDDFVIAGIEFYNKDQLLSTGLILRGNKEWEALLSEEEQLNSIAVNPQEIEEIYIENREGTKKMIVSDEKTIQMVLDSFFNGYESRSTYLVEIVMKDKSMRHWYGSFLEDKEPEFIVSDSLNLQ